MASQDQMKSVSRDCSDQLEDLAFELDVEPVEMLSTCPSKRQCYRMLEEWHKKRADDAMICVLCDALYACGLQVIADEHFGHILDTVLRKQTNTKHSTEQATGSAQTGNSSKSVCMCQTYLF